MSREAGYATGTEVALHNENNILQHFWNANLRILNAQNNNRLLNVAITGGPSTISEIIATKSSSTVFH